VDRQQVVDAFPDDTALRWLHRDRDSVYGESFRRRVAGVGIAAAAAGAEAPRFMARSRPGRIRSSSILSTAAQSWMPGTKLGWTPLMVAEWGQLGATVKEFPDAVVLLEKLMRERGMDPIEYSKAGAFAARREVIARASRDDPQSSRPRKSQSATRRESLRSAPNALSIGATLDAAITVARSLDTRDYVCY
jgi:hypothetical protein